MRALSKVLLVHLFTHLIHAIDDNGGTQFITYNGSLSGAYTYIGSDNKSCSTGPPFYFHNIVNTSLRIGVNPPWDSNPFFFELEHYGNSWNSPGKRSAYLSKRDYCFNSFGGCTYDAIYNLLFATACYGCSGGVLDLHAAKVTNTTGMLQGMNETVPMYVVEGNEKTWNSSRNRKNYATFEFQVPRNYTYEDYYNDICGETAIFYWLVEILHLIGKLLFHHINPKSRKDAQSFTYNLNFTNSSSAAIFSLSTSSANITLSFSGSRTTLKGSPKENLQPSNNETYTEMALADPRHNSMPHFTFANGTEIQWKKPDAWGGWSARSNASRKRGLHVKMTLCYSIVIGIALGS